MNEDALSRVDLRCNRLGPVPEHRHMFSYSHRLVYRNELYGVAEVEEILAKESPGIIELIAVWVETLPCMVAPTHEDRCARLRRVSAAENPAGIHDHHMVNDVDPVDQRCDLGKHESLKKTVGHPGSSPLSRVPEDLIHSLYLLPTGRRVGEGYFQPELAVVINTDRYPRVDTGEPYPSSVSPFRPKGAEGTSHRMRNRWRELYGSCPANSSNHRCTLPTGVQKVVPILHNGIRMTACLKCAVGIVTRNVVGTREIAGFV